MQVELLKGQLNELRSQNEVLFDSNRKLNELYEQARQESESNKEEAIKTREATRKANRSSIWAIVLSSIFSVSSIVAGVLIALYLQ